MAGAAAGGRPGEVRMEARVRIEAHGHAEELATARQVLVGVRDKSVRLRYAAR